MSNLKIPQRLKCHTCGVTLNGEMVKRLMRLLDSYPPLMGFAHVFDSYMCGKCCNHDRKMLQDTHPVSLSVSTMPNGNSVNLHTDTLGPGGKTSCITLSADVGADTVLYTVAFTRFVKPPTLKRKREETSSGATASGATASGKTGPNNKRCKTALGAALPASGAALPAVGAALTASGAALPALEEKATKRKCNETASLHPSSSPSILQAMLVHLQTTTPTPTLEQKRQTARDERNYRARLRRAEQNKAKEAAAKELRESREAAKLKQTEELRKSRSEGSMSALLAAAEEMQ